MNNGEQAADFLYLLLVLVLVGSALMVRRIPLGQGLRMFAAWVLIFGAAFMLFTLKDDFLALGQRMLQEVRGRGAVTAADGKELRIRQAEDGHFWVDGQINGEPVRFLVDSGATVTSISTDAAKRAGIETGGLPALVNTANGIVRVQSGRAERLDIGPIERRDLAVHVAESFGDMNVIGMNFLSSLSGWSVEGQWLVLKS